MITQRYIIESESVRQSLMLQQRAPHMHLQQADVRPAE